MRQNRRLNLRERAATKQFSWFTGKVIDFQKLRIYFIDPPLGMLVHLTHWRSNLNLCLLLDL